MKQRIWFITGISSGLGKSLTVKVLQKGDFVIGTFRDLKQVQEFNQLHGDKALGLLLDITKSEEIEKAIAIIWEKFGRVDVLVNNAGYGLAGAIEETSNSEVREIMEANFFGTLYITQQMLPILRRQRMGHIIQISSHGGIKAFAGFGIYNASKFAVEGFSEALAQEVASLGIKVTIIEPGPFRTNFAGHAFRKAMNRINDYDNTVGVFRQRMEQVHGKQEGDPEKAADAIYTLTMMDNPPLRQPLGKIAINSINAKIESLRMDTEAGRSVAEGTIFDT